MTTFTMKNTNASGVALMMRLPELTTGQIESLFGRGAPGYDDPDKGYGTEYRFVRDDTGAPVTLYDRWGMWRVGAWCMADAEEFVAWFSAKLRIPIATNPC